MRRSFLKLLSGVLGGLNIPNEKKEVRIKNISTVGSELPNLQLNNPVIPTRSDKTVRRVRSQRFTNRCVAQQKGKCF